MTLDDVGVVMVKVAAGIAVFVPWCVGVGVLVALYADRRRRG